MQIKKHYKFVDVMHIGFNISKTIDLNTLSDLVHVAKIVNKPILRIKGAEITHSGLPVLYAKAIYVVIDNLTYYRFIEKKRKDRHAK